MRTILKLSGSLFLLFVTLGHTQAEDAHADDAAAAKDLKEYDVEIIIFEDAHARYLTSQTWSHYANTTEQAPAAIATNKIKPGSFKSIKPAILKAQYKRING
ncbi:MAG: hypothetical protein ACNYZG_12060, partial [Gammaproteobacteria bacterium]